MSVLCIARDRHTDYVSYAKVVFTKEHNLLHVFNHPIPKQEQLSHLSRAALNLPQLLLVRFHRYTRYRCAWVSKFLNLGSYVHFIFSLIDSFTLHHSPKLGSFKRWEPTPSFLSLSTWSREIMPCQLGLPPQIESEIHYNVSFIYLFFKQKIH